MKKIVVSFFCLCIGFAASAQDVTEQTERNPRLTKNGYRYLPVKGDYAIGIGANPFLEYLGNMFTSGSNSAPLFNGVDNTIYGKYFLENNRAIRAKLRLNILNDKYKGTVANDTELANNPLNVNATIVDVKSISTQDIELSVGYEFRRGHGRVQGFYGGELGLGYTGGKATFDYGNPMTSLNQRPSTTDFNTNTQGNPSSRDIEVRYGKAFNMRAAAFVGVEYFFAPQISMGGELNLGLRYSILGQTESKVEYFDAASGKIQTAEWRSRNSNDLAFSVGLETVTSGSIFLLFHF